LSYNQTQLISHVLEDLGVIGAGETAATEDSTAVSNRIAAVVADLSTRRIVTIADTNAIAAAVFPGLVRILAEDVAPKFGRATDLKAIAAAEALLGAVARLDRTAGTGSLALAVLEQLQIWGAASAALDVTAVSGRLASILADLAARNIIYIISVDDVPDAALPHVTRYAAASLAPKPLYDVMREAERVLRIQGASLSSGAPLVADYF
jgi:hypothetical protein